MTHILKTSCGVTVEMDFNELTGQMSCQWSPDPPYSAETIETIRAEYEPWRNEIIQGWAERTGKKVAVISI